jgi:putative ribosome biogenesis GTPase RsgA
VILPSQKLIKKTIVIMGESRTGKSTLFNYFLKIPMEGKKNGRRDVQL